METIASAVRDMYFRMMRAEIVALQDRAGTLARAEMFDLDLRAELEHAHDHLHNALIRAHALLGES